MGYFDGAVLNGVVGLGHIQGVLFRDEGLWLNSEAIHHAGEWDGGRISKGLVQHAQRDEGVEVGFPGGSGHDAHERPEVDSVLNIAFEVGREATGGINLVLGVAGAA